MLRSMGSVALYSGVLALAAVASGCYDEVAVGQDTDTDTDTDGATTGGGTADSPATSEPGLDSTGEETGNAPLGVDAARMLLEPLVAAQCENTFSCCDANEVAYQLGSAVVDAADCTERTLEVLEAGGNPPYLQTGSLYLGGLLGFFAYGVDPSVVEVDEDAIATCVAALRDKPCAPSTADGKNCAPAEGTYVAQCDFKKLFIGTKSAAESCNHYSGLECGPGLSCDFFGADGGVCVAVLGQGDNCFEDYNCGSDLICDYASGQCSVPAGAGEACAYANPDNPVPGTEATRCQSGLVCNPVSKRCGARDCNFGDYCGNDDAACPEGLACVAGECDFPGIQGDQCYQDDDCAQGRCKSLDGGSLCQDPLAIGGGCSDHLDCATGYCDPTQGECAAKTAVGEACEAGQPDQQCDGGYCSGGECVAFIAVGEDCSESICNYIEGDQCRDGLCVPYPLHNGQACSSNFECESGMCDGTCQPPSAVGADCLPNGCADGAFCNAFTDGVCEAKKGWGVLCSNDIECWGSCRSAFGDLRCRGQGVGDALCDGA